MNSGASASSNDLPDELVIRILHLSNLKAILSFATTCKRYCHLVASSVSLQLHIELEGNELEIIEGSAKGATYSTILHGLRSWQSAWLDFNFNPPIKQVVGSSRVGWWELRDGAYIKSFSAARPPQSTPNSIQVFPLCSLNPLPPVQFPFIFDDFTVDLTQELAVLVKLDVEGRPCARVCLCSVTTGRPHPLAQHPVFTVEFEPSLLLDFQNCVVILDVTGSTLLIHFQSTIPWWYEILVWDWQSGALFYRISSRNANCDFAHLDKAHLVLYSSSYDNGSASWSPPEMLVYIIPTISSGHSYSIPPKSHFYAPSYACIRPILRLEFPRLHKSFSFKPCFVLRQDPFPGRIIHSSSTDFSYRHSRARTLGLTLVLNSFEATNSGVVPCSRVFRMFIDAGRLLDNLKHCKPGDMTTLPWKEWGKDATRWFVEPSDLIRANIDWISGSRLVKNHVSSPHLYDTYSNDTILSIVDFYTPTVERHHDRTSGSSFPLPESAVNAGGPFLSGNWSDLIPLGLIESIKVTRATQPSDRWDNLAHVNSFGSDTKTFIVEGFEEPVESRLPFRVVTLAQVVPNCRSWMIDNDHIIGVIDRPREPKSLQVYKLRTTSMGA